LKNGRADLFKTRRDQPDNQITLDDVCDRLVIHGSPEKVADQLLAFRDEVGDFGTLLYAGKDWADRELGRRSMVLLAEKVLPKLNAALR
jgi:alkanesulfonate monooxygenase SsuD/methylene tetrahydromethanopterin reductase-like flavin-dependent oxidoreductase (luciferase family)